MNIQYLNSQIEFVNNEEEFLSSNTAQAVIIVLDNIEVCYGKDDSCNTEYCDEHNINYVHQSKLQGGGCIVGIKDNIFIDAKDKAEGYCLSDRFSEALCQFLKSKGLDSVRCDNNDVLVDGYKVASGCETSINEWQYMGYQISMNQNIELIQNICNKEMSKIPKGLSEFNILKEDILQFCTNYWQKI